MSDEERLSEEDKSDSVEEKWANKKISWDEELTPLSIEIPPFSESTKLNDTKELSIFQKTKSLYEQQTSKFKSKLKDSIEEELTRHGTTTDKLNALSFQIENGEIYRLDLLYELLKYCGDRQYRRSSQSIEIFTNLMLYHLIPSDRNLNFFPQHNLTFLLKKRKKPKIGTNEEESSRNPNIGQKTELNKKRVLVLWYYENELKKIFSDFIKVCESHMKSNKTIMSLKTYIIKIFRVLLFRLHEGKDEIVEVLLGILKNPKNKFGKRIIYYFTTMINEQNSYYCFRNVEKVRLVKKIINLIFSLHADVVVNGIRLLRAFHFNHESEIELILLRAKIFLKIVQSFTKTAKKMDLLIFSKMLRTISISCRVLKFDTFRTYVDMFFDIARKSSNFQSAFEATKILFNLVKMKKEDEKLEYRFYMLLYDMLLRFDCFVSVATATEFLQVVKFAVLYDSNEPRVKSFVKRLVQICYHTTPNFATAALLVVRELVSRKPFLRTLLSEMQKTENDEPENEEGGDGDTKKRKKKKKKKKKKKVDDVNKYNPDVPNPSKANSENSQLWDMLGMKQHFHPVVSRVSNIILEQRGRLKYHGSPMTELSTSGFLNKFINYDKDDEETKMKNQLEEGDGGGEKETKDGEVAVMERRQEKFDREDERYILRFLELKKESEKEESGEKSSQRKRKRKLNKSEKMNRLIESNFQETEIVKSFESKKVKRKMADFSDNQIEKIFLKTATDSIEFEKDIDEQGDEEEEEEEKEETLEPHKKRRKFTHTFDLNQAHLEEEIQMLHEEEEDKMRREEYHEKKQVKVRGVDRSTKKRSKHTVFKKKMGGKKKSQRRKK